MLKTLVTLVRGRTFAIAVGVADQNALLILDQQMRDATGAFDRAKKALAVAIAQESQESQRLNATRSRIEDIETRAVAAIDAGRDDLAAEAAEAIATLEAERDASLTARTLFATEIAKLKGHVLQQQMRFSRLERGRRIARAAEAVRVARRGRIEGAPIFSPARSRKPRRRSPACASIRSRQMQPSRRLTRSMPRSVRSPSPRNSRPKVSVRA
jgi:phage shock protein A